MSVIFDSVSNRIDELEEIPGRFGLAATNACHTAVGIAFSALSVLSLGQIKQINQQADKTNWSKAILQPIYLSLMGIINPDTSFDNVGENVITSVVAKPIFKAAKEAASNEKSTFMKHVVSRGAYAVGAVVATITRLADLAIGIVAAIISAVTLGNFKSVNTLALRQLSALAVIDDVCYAIRNVVNPDQAY